VRAQAPEPATAQGETQGEAQAVVQDAAQPPQAAAQRKLGGRPGWWPQAVVAVVAAIGLALFFGSLHGIHLDNMNGLGLLSVLPAGVIAGVLLLAVAFICGLSLPRAQPVVLGAILVGLVVCLDGITAFAEPEPRFPTAYQIAGYVDYVAKSGHTAPGLAAYFSWAGFFALIAFVAGAAGTHGLLDLMRVWPMGINLLCLPPLFLIMRNLRISWRARWLAGFLFVVGNWVGQDYFSPQSYGFLLYLVFVAILVNWFLPGDEPRGQWPRGLRWLHWPRLLGRLDRYVFDTTDPGELPSREISGGQKAFLLVLLIALFTVITASHQLTPFFMIAAALGLAITHRGKLTTLPVLMIVILLGWVSFETVGYWSGHIRSIFGGFGDLGFNVTSSVGGRLTGSTPTHLLALHARVGVAGAIIVLAGLGLLRRRRAGLDDRVLLTLLIAPIALIAVQSYGGEIALRIYLFLLPAACVLAACLFFPREKSSRPRWFALPVLLIGALILPVGFLLARYGNEAFEQTPAGELAATNWVYAHDAGGVRLLWLSTDPVTDVTPEMPWSYQDLAKVVYVPALAPRNPAQVSGLISTLRADGPGSYLIATRTQVAAMQQTASYPTGWGPRFSSAMSATSDVRVAFTTSDSTVYTLRWPAGERAKPLGVSLPSPAQPATSWDIAELVLMWVLLATLGAREFGRMRGAGPRLMRVLTVSAVPLTVVFAFVVVIRFVLLS
jgi:hypothetical protein